MPLTTIQKSLVEERIIVRIRQEGVKLKSPKSSTWLISTIVDELSTLLDESDDRWTEVQALYQSIYSVESGVSPDSTRNSWVSNSGRYFQDYVRDYLNNALSSQGIRAVYLEGLKTYPELRTFLTLPARRRCVQKAFDAWPDNDIMLLTRAKSVETGPRVAVFGVLSCKASFRERVAQACFWALVGRDTGVRLGLATLDRASELATCERPNKIRMLLEAYFDRVFSDNPRTSFCGQIRPFSEIVDETRRWQRDVVPDFISEPW